MRFHQFDRPESPTCVSALRTGRCSSNITVGVFSKSNTICTPQHHGFFLPGPSLGLLSSRGQRKNAILPQQHAILQSVVMDTCKPPIPSARKHDIHTDTATDSSYTPNNVEPSILYSCPSLKERFSQPFLPSFLHYVDTRNTTA